MRNRKREHTEVRSVEESTTRGHGEPTRGAMPERVDASPEPTVAVLNPRYAGATPQQVALALLRAQPGVRKEAGRERLSAD